MFATRRLAIAVSVLAALAAGCGGGSSDSQQINRLARDFAKSAKQRDWGAMCDLMSAKARAQLAVAGALLGAGDCSKVLATAMALDKDMSKELDRLNPDKVTVTAIRVTGDSATGKMSPSDSRTTQFVRENGRWKLTFDAESAGSSTTTTGSAATPGVAAPKLQIPQRGFTYSDSGVSYGIAVRNPSTNDASEVSVHINFIGHSGDVLSTESENLTGIPAGKTAYVGGDTDTSGEKPVRMQVTTSDSGEPAGSVALPAATGAKLLRGEFGLTVRVQVHNTLDKPLSAIADAYAVLMDQNGRIVGGLSGFPHDDIPPGSRAAVKLDALRDVPGAVTAKAFVDGETE